MASEEDGGVLITKPNSRERRRGADTLVLAIGGTSRLFVLCGDEFVPAAVRAGGFSVRVVRCGGGSPVSMATCAVGDHRWLLAKDSTALCVGDRSFVFALPGLVYGLSLSGARRCEVLEEILGRFCAYHVLVGKEGPDPVDPNPEPDDWTHAHSAILKLASRSNAKIATTSPPEPPAAKIQRAMRMSAAVKLVSRALLSGALRTTDHLRVDIATTGAAHAYPTMWAVVSLLDAIEFGEPAADAVGPVPPRGLWCFKEEGLALLLAAVRAYSEAMGPTGQRKRPRVGEL